jgi:hypothetical protein
MELLSMSQRDLKRLEAVRRWTDGTLSQAEAASQAGLSERQFRRLARRLESEGPAGLIHRLRGRSGNRRAPAETIAQALELIREQYSDFGPTFANEKLRENHQIELSTETLRLRMIEAQLWQPHRRRRKKRHPPRSRRPCFGELIQIDGSPHDWFEGRAPRCSLLVFIDDATSRLVGLLFADQESTEAYFELARSYMLQYGKPIAIYSDRHSIFRHSSSIRTEGITQFGRALLDLDIELICATSPQAKGRVERANRTLQRRLVRELRLRNISSITEANRYLPEFIDDYNRRFAIKPITDTNVHRSIDESILNNALCAHFRRRISKDGLFNIEGTVFIVDDETLQLPCHAQVHHYGRHGFEINVNGKPVAYRRLRSTVEQAQIRSAKQINPHLDRRHDPKPDPRKAHRPPINHPWRTNVLHRLGPT